jgi:hypothetical protein
MSVPEVKHKNPQDKNKAANTLLISKTQILPPQSKLLNL